MSHRKALIRFFCLTIALLASAQAPGTAFAWKTNQAAELVLGQPDMNSAILTTAYGLAKPEGIAVDPTTGKLFVADSGNNRVLRFGSAAAISNGIAAEAVLGQADLISSSAGISRKEMYRPFGVVVDTSGRLWVSDEYNHRILRFDNAASLASGASANGVLGQYDFTSHHSSTSQYGLSAPTGMAIESNGCLWVSDTGNHRILRFDHAAGKANGGSADGVLGQSAFDTKNSEVSASGMNYPVGLAVDGSGNLWVANNSANRVLRFDAAYSKANGAAADSVLGQPDFTSAAMAVTPTGMVRPSDVSIDNNGSLWVADANASRVLRFDNAASRGNGVSADGVLGEPDFISSSPITSQSGMAMPAGVFADNTGRLWVSDTENNRVLRFDIAASKANGASADGVLGHTDFTSNGTATATPTLMHYPNGVAIDPTSGKLFVVDNGNNRVLRFANAIALQNGAAAEAVFGQPNLYSNLVPRSTTAGVLYDPNGIAIDQDEHLWVADTSNNRVLRFDNAATKASGVDADAVLGQTDFFSSSMAQTSSGMNHPSGLAVDEAGRLWVADTMNNRLLRFDGAASLSNGAPANGVLGQANYTTAGGSASRSGLDYPIGVAIDRTGTLWISEWDNNRVLRFDEAAKKANGADADGVLGQMLFTTNAHTTSPSGLTAPHQIAVDGLGRLWVADSHNNRVLWFNDAAGKANGADADGVLGQADFSSAVASTTDNGLYQPQGIAVSTTGFVWVVDTSNHRMLRFTDHDRVNMPMITRN